MYRSVLFPEIDVKVTHRSLISQKLKAVVLIATHPMCIYSIKMDSKL
jgi:hypothetical protein